ncbi:MAG: primosomal protein N' [Deltaproteobacteria bacterium]|nr:primosomal protein N' [Deltaproteobacteria bacterium]
MPYFQVIVPPLDHLLTYEIPSDLFPEPKIGQRVLVPLRKKWVTGYLWEEIGPPEAGPEIKAVSEILDPSPIFSEDMRPFFLWIARYYLYPLGQVLKAALPPGLSVSSYQSVEITPHGISVLQEGRLPEKEKIILQSLFSKGQSLSRFLPEEKSSLPGLEAMGFIQQTTLLKKESARPKKEKWIYPGACFQRDLFPEKDQPLFDLLSACSCRSLKDLRVQIPLSPQRLATLGRKGLVEIREQVCWRDPFGEILAVENGPLELTGEQAQALNRIKEGLGSGSYQTLLLHGITGSGKTEVYLRAAAEALEQGRQALILVPEIGLIPQMEGRFRLQFGEKIALLHSGLNPGERLDQWRRLQSGSAMIAIGTRSAIFAPLKALGLIVVDEEHDPSYKQTDSLRYNARDLALVRGQMTQAVVVLGSATPSISTLYLRRQKKIGYLAIHKRVLEQKLPEIHLIDLKKYRQGRRIPLFSPPLQEAMARNLDQGKQTLLFLNRRGFDTLILCTLCGAAIKCRNCSLTLTYHAREGRLQCHTCGYHLPLPERCPECHQAGIKALGMGTEKVEQELRALFPTAAIDRMDRDTVTRKKSHFEILKKLRDEKTDILIGTQMITKGHDFPQVTLIGVLCADLSLNWPDFRGGERTFQLLAQVAGRAGRGTHPGQVFIQTYNPDHYIFKYVCLHDYIGFYNQEVHFRRALKYPPFSRLINVLFQGNVEARVVETAGKTQRLLMQAVKKNHWDPFLELLGPVSAPIAKIKGRYRWQMLLKGENSRILHQAAMMIRQAEKDLSQGKGVQIILDMDPVDML